MGKKRVLITGVSGLLGSNLALAYRESWEIHGLHNSFPLVMDGVVGHQADLRFAAAIAAIIDKVHPEIVIHCAALADVDYCEEHPVLAEEINVCGTRNLVIALKKETQFVYISTDSVYDGVKGNFSEDDPIGPLNCYARSKRQGELEALKHLGTMVVRTNIFGWSPQVKRLSLAEWALVKLGAKEKIRGFTDVYFSSIYTMDLAVLLREAIEKRLSGVYNIASSSAVSKCAFLCEVARMFDLDPELIEPVSVDSSNLKARRAKALSLDVSKLQSALKGHKVPSCFESLQAFHRDFMEGVPALVRVKERAQC